MSSHVPLQVITKTESEASLRAREGHLAASIDEDESPLLPPDEVEKGFELERPTSNGNSVLEASFHLVCVIAGSGVLQLPFALRQSGWAGIIIVLLSAAANDYSGRLLIKCLYAGPDRAQGFAHIGERAFGRPGRIMVEIFGNAMLLGVPVVYLILAGMNFQQLFGLASTRIWICFHAALVTIPFLIYKDLKEIALLSAFGVFATVLVIVTLVLFSLAELQTSKASHKLIDIVHFPAALGSVSFSYAGNFVYPEVEASMKEPSKFPTVLLLSMLIISAMYLVTAICGYAAYGENTVSPILNNLPAGWASQFAIALITIHVLLALPILVTTFAVGIENSLQVALKGPGERPTRMIVRVSIMLVIVVLAVSIPFFATFMTLLGALANTALIFIFPVIFDFKLFGFGNRPIRERIVGILMVCMGLYGGLLGGTEAFLTLLRNINGENTEGPIHR